MCRYICFDVEVDQDLGKHVPNLVIAHSQCSNCLESNRAFDEPLVKKRKNQICVCPAERRMTFENFEGTNEPPVQQFINWAMRMDSKQRFKTFAISHNGGFFCFWKKSLNLHFLGKYDMHLMFEQYLQMNITPRFVANGFKIYK